MTIDEKYTKQIEEFYKDFKENATIALRTADGFIVAKAANDITAHLFSEELDGDESMMQNVLYSYVGINCVLKSALPATLAVAETGKKIPPILDDLAQIVGASVKVSSGATNNVVKKLRGRNACLIKNVGAIVVGRTIFEAVTATKVLDKGAKAYVESTIIGGAKAISPLEANLMHIIYKMKYSKKDQTAKMEEMK